MKPDSWLRDVVGVVKLQSCLRGGSSEIGYMIYPAGLGCEQSIEMIAT